MDAEEKRSFNNVVPFFGESATGCASGEVYGCAPGEVFGCAFGEVFGCAFGEVFGRAFGEVFGCAFGEVYGCAFGEVFGCAFGEVTSCASFLAALLASLHLFVHCMAAFLLCSAVWYFFNLPHGPVGRPHPY